MRTINKKTYQRLVAQAEEAKTLNMTKLAEHLDTTTKDKELRTDNESYSYTHEQMQTDVERALWNATLRIADYFGNPFDALQAQAVIEKMAEDLIDEMRVVSGNDSGVGPYDSPVPGEHPERVMFELEVSDD